MSRSRILICDDEPAICKTLSEILEDEGYEVESVDSGESLVSRLVRGEKTVDALLLDVWLPGMDGVEALGRIRELGFEIPVIVISGHATLDQAIQAVKIGAYDFLEKPLNLDKVILTLGNALKQSKLERKKKQLEAGLPRVEMIGDSEVMQRLKEDIELAAPSKGRVLILGESGAGKEVAARMIHALSDRADEAFIEMNCAAIPENLIESELFGHEKGSFTDAKEKRVGKFELADRGTLFLDEIADMSLATQAKVLRILQEQRFQPVGSGKTIQVDVRVIAATNKDLEEEIREGRFREDLYFRLNVVPLVVPPLRERPDDIEPLCRYFLNVFSKEHGKPAIWFEDGALAMLKRYRWPGNIRELRNLIERLMIMTRKPLVSIGDLPRHITGDEGVEWVFADYGSLKEARDDFEKKFIAYHLKKNQGNVTKTAELLKIERSNLHKKIKQFEIEA